MEGDLKSCWGPVVFRNSQLRSRVMCMCVWNVAKSGLIIHRIMIETLAPSTVLRAFTISSPIKCPETTSIFSFFGFPDHISISMSNNQYAASQGDPFPLLDLL